MAEVFAQYDEPLTTVGGRRFVAQVCGAPTEHGLWQGWIEFVPLDDGPAIQSARETTQPNRTDTAYWATGLTRVYLEGALHRALGDHPPRRQRVNAEKSIFDGPAYRPPKVSVSPLAILDPFSVYRKGEVILRRELEGLARWHLVNIIEAYDLSEQPVAALNETPDQTLVALIVGQVRDRAGQLNGRARTM